MDKKISLPAAILVMLFVTFAGALESLASITGFGIIISELISMTVTFFVEMWLFFIGARGARQLATFAVGSIADGLAGNFLAVFIEPALMALTIYFVNHPPEVPAVATAASK